MYLAMKRTRRTSPGTWRNFPSRQKPSFVMRMELWAEFHRGFPFVLHPFQKPKRIRGGEKRPSFRNAIFLRFVKRHNESFNPPGQPSSPVPVQSCPGKNKQGRKANGHLLPASSFSIVAQLIKKNPARVERIRKNGHPAVHP